MKERRFEILTGEQLNNLNKDWPVTYILKSPDGKKVYIGITTNFKRRMSQHQRDESKKELTEKVVISNTHANQSITYYLESFLIHHGRMNPDLKSINTKMQDGELFKEDNFYEKKIAKIEAEEVYRKLHEMDVFKNTIEQLKENAFSKIHPDLLFTNDQNEIIDQSINLINSKKTFYIKGSPGTGKTAILLKLVNDFHLYEKTNRKITLGVYSASKQNRTIIKRFVSLIMNECNVLFFETLSDVAKYISGSNKDIHLLVDESQSLDGGNYASAIHIKKGLDSELEWIDKNLDSYTLFFDPQQTDYGRDIDIYDLLDDANEVLELKDQFRIDADRKIFELFKEMVGLEGDYKNEYSTNSFSISFVDGVNDGIKKIVALNKDNNKKIHRALNPNYNKSEYKKWFNGGCPYFESYEQYKKAFHDSRNKDVINNSRVEMFLNSKRVKGMSIDSSFVWIGDEVDYINGRVVIDWSKWSFNVFQNGKKIRTDQEKINIIKNTYLILLSRASENLIIYASNPSMQKYLEDLVSKKLKKKDA